MKISELVPEDLMELARSTIYIMDPRGVIVKVNSAVELLLGYSRHEVVGKKITDFMEPEFREGWFKKAGVLFEEGYMRHQARFIKKDGSLVYVDCAAVLVKDEDGSPLAIIALQRDITDVKKMEERLKEREELYRTIVEQSHEGIYIHKNEKLLFANKKLADMLGYDLKELYSISDVFTILHPDIREAVRESAKKRMAGMLPEKSTSFTAHLLRKDGTKIFAEFNVKLINYRGDKAFLGVVRDITDEVRMHKELKEAEQRFKVLVENIPVGVAVIKEDRFVYINPSWNLTRYREEELKSMKYWELIHPDHRFIAKQKFKKALNGERVAPFECSYITKDGRRRWSILAISSFEWEGEKALLLTAIDITPRKHLEQRLKESEEKFATLAENAPVGVFLYGEYMEYINPYLQRLLGYTLDEIRQKRPWEIVHPRFQESVRLAVRRRLKGERFPLAYDEIILMSKDSKEIFARVYTDTVVMEGSFKGIGIVIDLGEKKELENRLSFLANYDTLTGLPNRRFFVEELKRIISKASRNQKYVAVMELDIREFYKNNVIYGSTVMDKVLIKIGEKLRSLVRAGDVVARFHSDNFGIILSDLSAKEDIYIILDRINRAFQKPIVMNDIKVEISFDIGIALYPHDAKTPEELMERARAALFRATESKHVVFFSEDLEKELREVEELKSDMVRAVKFEEFVVYYQPIVDLKGPRIVGAEALVRWMHPKKGLIPPLRFIPIAEKTGIIIDIGRLVMRKAILQFRDFVKNGKKEFLLAINLSPRQFEDPDLIEFISEMLRLYNFPPENLKLEITETTAMRNPERAKRIIDRLKSLGIKIAIDDFGTGYSHMAYLVDFEVDLIKIDRSFVVKMPHGSKAEEVVKGIVNLSHSIGAEALAEGVETENVLLKLKNIGCDKAQGYFFSPPVPFDDFKKLL